MSDQALQYACGHPFRPVLLYQRLSSEFDTQEADRYALLRTSPCYKCRTAQGYIELGRKAQAFALEQGWPPLVPASDPNHTYWHFETIRKVHWDFLQTAKEVLPTEYTTPEHQRLAEDFCRIVSRFEARFSEWTNRAEWSSHQLDLNLTGYQLKPLITDVWIQWKLLCPGCRFEWRNPERRLTHINALHEGMVCPITGRWRAIHRFEQVCVGLRHKMHVYVHPDEVQYMAMLQNHSREQRLKVQEP